MASRVDDVYERIEKDANLKKRIKMIGIGVGNTAKEVGIYRQTFKVPFPLFTDDDFAIHKALGEVRTPYFIGVKINKDGSHKVFHSKLGAFKKADKFLQSMIELSGLKMDISGIHKTREEGDPSERDGDLAIPVSEQELMHTVKQALSADGEEPGSIKKVALGKLGTVYVATVAEGKKGVFARVVARRVPCMDCHNVFFVYSFDEGGDFLRFIPLYITKRYNKAWNTDDVRKIEKSFSGKSFLTPVDFNPFVDAVSSATISSKLVFHSMNQTREVYEELAALGFASKKP